MVKLETMKKNSIILRNDYSGSLLSKDDISDN